MTGTIPDCSGSGPLVLDMACGGPVRIKRCSKAGCRSTIERDQRSQEGVGTGIRGDIDSWATTSPVAVAAVRYRMSIGCRFGRASNDS